VKSKLNILFAVLVAVGLAGIVSAQQPGTENQQAPQNQNSQQFMQMMGRCNADYQAAMNTAQKMQSMMHQARESNDPARMSEALSAAGRSLSQMQSRMSACSQNMGGMRQRMMGQSGMMTGQQGMMGQGQRMGRSGMMNGQQGMMGGQGRTMGQGMMNGQGQMTGTSGTMASRFQAFDPVCRANIANNTAPTATYQGRTYRFCTQADKELFLKDPAQYLGAGR
jgi:YHS domain-containing protein